MIIQPQWPAPKNIKAVTTLRWGGVSPAPYDSFNLATHVGDNEDNVLKNRQLLRENLSLLSEPYWLNQTHSTVCVNLDRNNIDADASYSTEKNKACVILTADCLPLLICNTAGSMVAAIHGGWRGLAGNIIQHTVSMLSRDPNELMAWLGPAIGPAHFEVGDEVREIFIKNDRRHETAFTISKNNHYLCNIYTIAKNQLNNLGITKIYGGEYCTYSDAKNFYSYRRDGAKTGRMASMIWIA